MTGRGGQGAAPDADRLPGSVAAVVVTYRRRRLAGDLVRSLLEVEGFDPDHVVVVVNGDGGLDDEELESRVRMHRMATNAGPAAAFRHGLAAVFADPSI